MTSKTTGQIGSGPEAVYPAMVGRLLDWLIADEAITDAQQLNAYTVGATLHNGERIEIPLQWRPARAVGARESDVARPEEAKR